MKLKELFGDCLPLINKFAPTIGAAFGGPFGLAAGYVIPFLADAFQSTPTDMKKLSESILNDVASSDKLQALEKTHGTMLSSLMETVNNLSEAEITIKLKWQ